MKSSRLFLKLQADRKLIPHAQQFRCAMLWQSRHRLPSNHLTCSSAGQRCVHLYSLTGIHISRPPLPVSGSKFSS
jgi:hypothetical protein